MPLIELSTALVAAGSGIVVPFVNKALEKTATRAGDVIDAHLVNLFTKAHHLLAATGREPQPVEPKVIVPLVQAASLETESGLIDKWAALLANAADADTRAEVQPSYVEVLRQLTPTDAQVAGAIYLPSNIMEGAAGTGGIDTARIMHQLKLSYKEINSSIGNFLRLRLCETVLTYGAGDPSMSYGLPKTIMGTVFGRLFIIACSPPTK